MFAEISVPVPKNRLIEHEEDRPDLNGTHPENGTGRVKTVILLLLSF